MSTKHNTEINENPLSKEYFDDVLDMFYDNNEKNEEFYKELHNTYSNNQPTGFSLGTSRSTIDLTRTLSELRSNAIAGTTALFNAKKSIAELELKKKSQSIEAEKANNDKEYIRAVLSEINNEDFKKKSIPSRNLNTSEGRELKNSIDETKRILEQKKLDERIKEKLNNGSISFTKNEKAMKYDFNNEAEVVYDNNTSSLKAVRKGTTQVLNDYPIERGQVGEITRIDTEEGYAYADNGKKVRITSVK